MKHLPVHGLDQVRLAANLTQAQVAERMGCSQAKVSKLEKLPFGDMKLADMSEFIRACGLVMRVNFIEKSPAAELLGAGNQPLVAVVQ